MRWTALVAIAVTACAPDLVDDASIVRAPRVLAARTDPPEAAPGGTVTTTALWAGPEGSIADAPLDWAFCIARKTLTTPGPVAPACLVAESPDLVELGTGASATGHLPETACRLFGPDRPDPVPGEPAGRPADPDGTGGYYQPVRVLAPDERALVEIRIRCGLPGATPEQSREYVRSYVPNTHPTIAATVPLDAAATTKVPAGELVDLAVHWPSCGDAPCSGAEPYLWFDPDARTLTMRHEAMRVSWFASAGDFATSHTGRTEAETDVTAPNQWTAPDAPGLVHLWVVLRDDRGGVAWATYAVEVTR